MSRKPIPHGTINAYTNRGCRCDRCKGAWADYNKGRRAARSTRVPNELHGKSGTYNNWGCRCDLCRAEHRARAANYRKTKGSQSS